MNWEPSEIFLLGMMIGCGLLVVFCVVMGARQAKRGPHIKTRDFLREDYEAVLRTRKAVQQQLLEGFEVEDVARNLRVSRLMVENERRLLRREK